MTKKNLIFITGVSRWLWKELLFKILSKVNNINFLWISRNTNNHLYDNLSLNWNNLILNNLDLNNIDDVEKFLDKNKKLFSNSNKIIFINNAAIINPLDYSYNYTKNEIKNSININFLSPTLICSNLFNIIKKYNKNCLFVNITSGVVNTHIEWWWLYSSSKSWIHNFFEVLNKEINSLSIRGKAINIDPWLIDTGMQKIIRNNKNFNWAKSFSDAKINNKLLTTSEVADNIISKSYLLNFLNE